MASISDLAPELLSFIAEYANCEPSLMNKLRKDPSYSRVHNLSTPSIRNLCLVSQSFHAVSIPILYRSIVVNGPVLLLFEEAEKHPIEDRCFALFRSHTRDVRVTMPPDLSLLTRLLSSLPRLERVRWATELDYAPGVQMSHIPRTLLPLEDITAMPSWRRTYSLNLCCSDRDDALKIQPCISPSSGLKVLHLTGFHDIKQVCNILTEGRMPPLEKLVVQRLHFWTLNQANTIWDWSALVHLELRESNFPDFFNSPPPGRISSLKTFITDGSFAGSNYTDSTRILSEFLTGMTGLEHLELQCTIRHLDMSIFKNHGDTLCFLGIRDYRRNDTRLVDIPQLDPDSLNFINRTCPRLVEIQIDMTINPRVSMNPWPHLRKTAGRTIKTGGFDKYWDSIIQWRTKNTLENLCRFRNLRRLTLCIWVTPPETPKPPPSETRDDVQKLVDYLVNAKEGVPFEQINVHAAFWSPLSTPPNFSDVPARRHSSFSESVHFIYDTAPHPAAPAAEASLYKTKIYL